MKTFQGSGGMIPPAAGGIFSLLSPAPPSPLPAGTARVRDAQAFRFDRRHGRVDTIGPGPPAVLGLVGEFQARDVFDGLVGQVEGAHEPGRRAVDRGRGTPSRSKASR